MKSSKLTTACFTAGCLSILVPRSTSIFPLQEECCSLNSDFPSFLCIIYVILNNIVTGYQYHPTSRLMQILHFNWLLYQRTISNSYRVAKFAGFSFVLFPNKHSSHLLTLLLPFLSYHLGDTKTITPFALKGHGSIDHSASPHGLLTFRLQV